LAFQAFHHASFPQRPARSVSPQGPLSKRDCTGSPDKWSAVHVRRVIRLCWVSRMEHGPQAQISLRYPIARGNCPLTIPTSYDWLWKPAQINTLACLTASGCDVTPCSTAKAAVRSGIHNSAEWLDECLCAYIHQSRSMICAFFRQLCHRFEMHWHSIRFSRTT